MSSRSSSALRKPTAQRKPASKKAAAKKTITKNVVKNKAGPLPEWNLADLYSGIDAPEVARDGRRKREGAENAEGKDRRRRKSENAETARPTPSAKQ